MTVLTGVLFPTRITGAKAVISQAFYFLFIYLLFYYFSLHIFVSAFVWLGNANFLYICIFPFSFFPF